VKRRVVVLDEQMSASLGCANHEDSFALEEDDFAFAFFCWTMQDVKLPIAPTAPNRTCKRVYYLKLSLYREMVFSWPSSGDIQALCCQLRCRICLAEPVAVVPLNITFHVSTSYFISNEHHFAIRTRLIHT
jgi:hypothetical protein